MIEPTVDEIRKWVSEADEARELFKGPDPHDREEKRYSAMHAAEARAGSLANVRVLLAEVARLREADAWQPIETAPVGERVLVWGVPGTILAALDAERHQQTRAMIAALYWRAGRLHMQAQARRGTPFYGSYQAEYEGVWSAAHAMERHL